MRIENLKTSIKLKKEEGKRIALYNGSSLHMQEPVIAIIDYERGYHALMKNGFEYHEMAQEEINQFNKEQGLNNEAVELMLTNSMRGA